MTLIIRPVRAEDYPALAAISTAAFPSLATTAEELEEEDSELKPPLKHGRWVAELDGQPAGGASYWQSPSRYHPQKFWLDLLVHPNHQGKGIGAALYNQITAELAPFSPIQLRTFSREDLPHGIRFFAKRNYREAKRTWESHLDVAAFDFGPYAGVIEQVEAQGIQIATLAELKGRPGWEQAYLDLVNAIQRDVPDIDPAVEIAYDQFIRSYVEASNILPEGHFFALDGDRWVGLSTLHTSTQEGALSQGLTGVIPEYRHRKIALALKLKGVAYAREHGWAKIRTQNASNNRPMLAINEAMGFIKQPAWFHLVLKP